MPNLVKIGRTSQDDAGDRIAQLYTTGVPFPFKLEFACKVENPDEVEEALHLAFGPQRVNPKREFFKIEAEQAIAILKLLHSEDATSEVKPQVVDPQEVVAADKYRASRRPNFNFDEMGIPIGSTLVSTKAGRTVVVSGPKKVRLGDDEMSLSAATKQILEIGYNVAPNPYWTYNGKLLSDIYEDTYDAED